MAPHLETLAPLAKFVGPRSKIIGLHVRVVLNISDIRKKLGAPQR